MANLLSSIEASLYRVFRRQPPPGKLHRVGFWLLISFAVLQAMSYLPGRVGGFGSGFKTWALFFLLLVYFWVGFRWIFRHLLWKVWNRLIVTYLLMGLAPVVLFGTLALAAAYVFSGEFAISRSPPRSIRNWHIWNRRTRHTRSTSAIRSKSIPTPNRLHFL